MNFYKKSCLILLPIFLASSVQAATVYNDEAKGVSLSVFGRIETGFYNKFSEINESSDEDDAKARVHGEGRLGVMGKSRIASNVYGLAFGEWEVTTQTSDNGKFDTRYAYVGFDFNHYGTLVFGQGDTASYLTVGMTDVFEKWGNEANSYWDFGGRQEGQVMYSYSLLGYSLALSYQTPQRNFAKYTSPETNIERNLDLSYGGAISFAYNWQKGFAKDLAFSIGMDYYDMEKSNINGDRRSFNIGLAYGRLYNGIYVATTFNKTKYTHEHNHTYGHDLVAGYAFENGISFMLGGGYYTYDYRDTLKSYGMVHLGYNFNENMKVYGESRIGIGRLDFPVANQHQHTKYVVNFEYNF